MTSTDEDRGFDNWFRAFRDKKLDPDHLAILQEMVDDGRAKNLAQAAQMLDWQETVIDPPEHMYGH